MTACQCQGHGSDVEQGLTPCAGQVTATPVVHHAEEKEAKRHPQTHLVTTRLRIENLCCEMETSLVHSLLEPMIGVNSVKVNSIGRVAIIRHDKATSPASLVDALNAAHLGASIQELAPSHIPDVSPSPAGGGGRPSLRLLLKKATPCVPLVAGLIGLFVALLAPAVGISARTVNIVVGVTAPVAAAPMVRPLARAIQYRRIDMNVLFSISVIGALVLDQLAEAMSVLVLIEAMQMLKYAALGYVSRLLDVTGGHLPPTMATLVDGTTVPVDDVGVGQVVVVRAGEQVPTDGVVVSGKAAVDESTITGEACPVEKMAGSPVFGGTICQSGALNVKCTKAAGQSSLAKIRDMVQGIAASRSPVQETVDIFAAYYTPAVLFIALIYGTYSSVFGASVGDARWRVGLYNSLQLLVLGCPCALMMAAPLPFVAALSSSVSRAGVLFKSATALANLGRIKVLACDKTGTLTEGRFTVTSRVKLGGARLDADLTSKLAASLETRVAHPLADALVRDAITCISASYCNSNADGAYRMLGEVEDVVMLEGKGVQGTVVFKSKAYKVMVGNEALLLESRDNDKQADGQQQQQQQQDTSTLLVSQTPIGATTLFVVVDGQPELALTIADTLRASVPTMIQKIHRLGIQTALLTGDAPQVAEMIRNEAGLGSVTPRMRPADKMAWIKARQCEATAPHPTICCCGTVMRLEVRKTLVGMIGDGINDGPSLLAADAGIAMGQRGTALAVQSADIVLLTDDLTRVPQAIRMSRATQWVVIQNVVIALGIKLLAGAVVLAGRSQLWEAVASDGLTLGLVVLNGMRPLWLARRIYPSPPPVEA